MKQLLLQKLLANYLTICVNNFVRQTVVEKIPFFETVPWFRVRCRPVSSGWLLFSWPFRLSFAVMLSLHLYFLGAAVSSIENKSQTERRA